MRENLGKEKIDHLGNPSKLIFTVAGLKNKSWFNLQSKEMKTYLLGEGKKPASKKPRWWHVWKFRKTPDKNVPVLAIPTSTLEKWVQPKTRNK